MSNAFDEKDSRIRRILSFKETDKQIISKKVLTSDSDVNDIQFNSTHSNSRYNSRLMTKNKQHYINDSNLKRDISSDDDFNKQVYSIQGKSSYNRKSRTNTPKENIQSNHEKNQDKSSLRKSRYNHKLRSNTPKANISLHQKKNSLNHSKKKINSNEDISSEDESNMHVDSIQGKSRSNTPKANISLHHKKNSFNHSKKKINSNEDISSEDESNMHVDSIQGKSRYNLKSRSNTPKANISLHHKKNSFNHSKKKINSNEDISSDDESNMHVDSIQGKSRYNLKSRSNTPKANISLNHKKNSFNHRKKKINSNEDISSEDESNMHVDSIQGKSRYNLKSRSNTPKANISLHHKKNSFNHSKKKINSNEDISSEDESNMHVDSIQGKSRSNTPKANISLHHKNNSLNDSNKKINSNDDITSDNDKSSYNRKSSHHFISKKTKKKNIASIHKTPGKHDRKQINANNNHNENDIMTQLTAKYSNKGNNSIQTGSNKKSQEHNSSNNDSNVSIKNNNKKMRSNKEILSGEIKSPIDLSPSEDQHLRNLNYIQVKSRNPNKESPVQHSIPIVDVHKDKNVMETPRRSPNFKSIEDLQRSTSKKNCDLRRNVLLTQASNIITPRQLIPSESDPVSNPMLFSPIISSNTNKKMTNFKDRMIAINTG